MTRRSGSASRSSSPRSAAALFPERRSRASAASRHRLAVAAKTPRGRRRGRRRPRPRRGRTACAPSGRGARRGTRRRSRRNSDRPGETRPNPPRGKKASPNGKGPPRGRSIPERRLPRRGATRGPPRRARRPPPRSPPPSRSRRVTRRATRGGPAGRPRRPRRGVVARASDAAAAAAAPRALALRAAAGRRPLARRVRQHPLQPRRVGEGVRDEHGVGDVHVPPAVMRLHRALRRLTERRKQRGGGPSGEKGFPPFIPGSVLPLVPEGRVVPGGAFAFPRGQPRVSHLRLISPLRFVPLASQPLHAFRPFRPFPDPSSNLRPPGLRRTLGELGGEPGVGGGRTPTTAPSLTLITRTAHRSPEAAAATTSTEVMTFGVSRSFAECSARSAATAADRDSSSAPPPTGRAASRSAAALASSPAASASRAASSAAAPPSSTAAATRAASRSSARAAGVAVRRAERQRAEAERALEVRQRLQRASARASAGARTACARSGPTAARAVGLFLVPPAASFAPRLSERSPPRARPGPGTRARRRRRFRAWTRGTRRRIAANHRARKISASPPLRSRRSRTPSARARASEGRSSGA